jgi:predicted pyridoxine 5'-phosphate oxidase superfamily flavin-nucleotide-binding protein
MTGTQGNMGRFASIAFTPRVKAEQERRGSRRAYARADNDDNAHDALGESEKEFLEARDSFYMASVGETGWPYVQHRGGPKGFVKVLDPHTLAFPDYRGNKQYISLGNVGGDDRVALIFVDYPNRARLKVLARASAITASSAPEVMTALATGGSQEGARIERGFVLRVEGFDWNCPQYITPRFTEDEVHDAVAPLLAKLEAADAENRDLRASLARLTTARDA